MSWFEIVTERKIHDAQEEGAFDNLPGKGKPLNLEMDRRIPPELRAAYRIMKESGVLPDWIQLDKEIRQRQERWQTRQELFTQKWTEEAEALRTRRDRAREEVLDTRRDAFLDQATRELQAQNGMIDRLNLIVPSVSRQRVRLNLRERITELEALFPRFHPHRGGAEAPWEVLLRAEEERRTTQLSNRMPLRRKQGSIG